ncbi:MAG: type II toxin-antitoxin system HicB family antitoxin [bacterium]|nr:type II toxin-antitoxin system HicB family antitoxin [bacterium]
MAEIVLKVQSEQLENGDYLATSDDVPGLVVQGCTVAETLGIARDVTQKLIESYLEHGDELPPQLHRHQPEKFEIDIPVSFSS